MKRRAALTCIGVTCAFLISCGPGSTSAPESVSFPTQQTAMPDPVSSPSDVVVDRPTPSLSETSQPETRSPNEPQLRIESQASVGSSAIAADLSPDGRTLYVLDRAAEEVVFVDTTSLTVVHKESTGNMPVGLAVLQSGLTIAVSNSSDGTVSLIDIARQKPTVTVPVSLRVGVLASSPTKDAIFVVDELQKSIAVIDANEQQITRSRPIDWRGLPTALTLTPDGGTLLMATGNDLVALNPRTLKTVATYPVGDRAYGLVPAQEQDLLYARTASNGILAIDNVAGDTTRTYLSGQMIKGLALSPSGAFFYASAVSGGVDVVAVATATSNVVSTLPMAEIPGDMVISDEGSRLYVLQESAGRVVVVGTAI